MLLFLFLDNKDTCLDIGYCKQGLKINTESGLIEINKENCKKHNWQWDEKSKSCYIKQN